MSRFYVRAGLHAEGPAADRFLTPLLDRLLVELLSSLYPAQHYFSATLRIADEARAELGRDRRIAAAIASHTTACTLFILHTDGSADCDAVHDVLDHGIALAQTAWKTAAHRQPLAVATCVPVRALAAWLLVDPGVFARLGAPDLVLPAEPDQLEDPARVLAALLARAGFHRAPPFDFFGENVSLDALRKLASFRVFEAELIAALRLLARPA